MREACRQAGQAIRHKPDDRSLAGRGRRRSPDRAGENEIAKGGRSRRGPWRRSAPWLLIATVAVLGRGAVPTAMAACPNEQLRQEQVSSLRLPDCRAFEQVSPVDKSATDALGEPDQVQGSPTGKGVTYFSLTPFPGVAGSAEEFPSYVSTRDRGEWATQGLLPEADPGSFTAVTGITEDLSQAVIFDFPSSPPLTANTTAQFNYYLRDNVHRSYRRLAPSPGFGESHFVDATPDGSRIIFDSEEHLLEDAAPGVTNLYEYDVADERLSLAGILPGGEPPAGGAVGGPGGPALEGQRPAIFYSQDTISENGSRIVFSDLGTGQIYVRENGAATVEASASQRAVAEEEKPAFWRASTPDGRYVFFTSEAKLTEDATASAKRPDLYRFDVETGKLSDLTTAAPEGAGVQGTLGGSADGSYVYFAAEGVLAPGAPAGTGCAEGAVGGHCNLYRWHDGTTALVASLDAANDRADWRGFQTGEPTSRNGEKSSRVTSDGKTVLFTSVAQLTGHDNAGHNEIYLANVEDGTPVCVSCNPSGPSADNAFLVRSFFGAGIPTGIRNAFLTRNLSADGSRVFFETEESLALHDNNGQMDVYEWEREGSGTCPGEHGNCLYLISTGQSIAPSYFGDASADGSDVFFFTRQPLVSQDQDNNADIYDARVEGGIPAQNPPPPSPPCAGDPCRGASAAPPGFVTPSSSIFSGDGNLSPPTSGTAPSHAKKPLTRAQKLAKALKTCRRKPRTRRHSCEARARRTYGTRAGKSGQTGGAAGRHRR